MLATVMFLIFTFYVHFAINYVFFFLCIVNQEKFNILRVYPQHNVHNTILRETPLGLNAVDCKLL